MLSGFESARKTVFGNRRVASKAKSQYVESLLYSRLLFDASVWEDITTSSMNKLRHAYMTPLRVVTNKVITRVSEVRFSNMQVLVDAESLPVECRIRIAKPKYMPSLLKHASPQHLRLTFSSAVSSEVVGCLSCGRFTVDVE